MTRILILYSSPPDQDRLRLDKEHRRIDLALKRAGLGSDIVDRLHATSIDDLATALQNSSYEIVQFSGHGSSSGIVLETDAHRGSTQVPAAKVAELLRHSCPKLRVAIFLCCYSADTLPLLTPAAPFLLTVFGPLYDEAAIEFIGEFYEIFFSEGSVERAFHRSLLLLDAKGITLDASLSRRAEQLGDNRSLVHAYPTAGKDSILIDLTDAAGDISSLDIDQERFLSILTRKIRIHRWIFLTPTDQAVLSLGPYFGIFSWEDAADVVYCKRILRLKDSADEKSAEVWAGLITSYNDHRVDRYRIDSSPASPLMEGVLREAIEDYYRLTDDYFQEGSAASNTLKSWVPNQYIVSRSLIIKYLEQCDLKFHRGDLSATVEYLESILSALHDLVDAFTDRITSNE